jgi:Protein of unknown function (DUF1629)
MANSSSNPTNADDAARADSARQAAEQSKSHRKYFLFEPDLGRSGALRPRWINEKELKIGLRATVRKPFSNMQFSQAPKLTFDRKTSRGVMLDAYRTIDFWIVSERLKAVLEQIDPEAFAFVRAEVEYKNFDSPGPDYWFADIVRILDCVDEENSDIKYQAGASPKNYLRLINAVMKADVVGSAHFFRLEYSPHMEITDDVAVKTLRKEGVKGFSFRELHKR